MLYLFVRTAGVVLNLTVPIYRWRSLTLRENKPRSLATLYSTQQDQHHFFVYFGLHLNWALTTARLCWKIGLKCFSKTHNTKQYQVHRTE